MDQEHRPDPADERRGVRKVGQMCVLNMAGYNLVRMRSLARGRPQAAQWGQEGAEVLLTGSLAVEKQLPCPSLKDCPSLACDDDVLMHAFSISAVCQDAGGESPD